MSDAATLDAYDSPFFILRTPLLPLDEFLAWSGQAASTWLLAQAERPELREALRVASPSLLEGLARHRATDPSGCGPLPGALAGPLGRYFTRMTSRATPFGLFAGTSVGTWRATSDLSLGPWSRCRRVSRLDSRCLVGIAAAVSARRPDVVTYRANPTLCRVGDFYRYVQELGNGARRQRENVSVEATDYLDRVLDSAGVGATREHLTGVLCASDRDIAEDEARAYVDELIQTQILVSTLALDLTAADPLVDLSARIARVGDHAVAGALARVGVLTTALDEPGLAGSADAQAALRAAWSRLVTLVSTETDGDHQDGDDGPGNQDDQDSLDSDAGHDGGPPRRTDTSGLPALQIALVKPSATLALGPRVMKELQRGVALLHRLSPPPHDWAPFRNAFVDRYGEREVRLCEVLDDEQGLGSDGSRAVDGADEPLLAGLGLQAPGREAAAWEARHDLLLREVLRASREGAQVITLGEPLVEKLSSESRPPLPDALAVLASLSAVSASAADQGNFQLLVQYVGGPSAANLFARAVPHHAELATLTERLMRAEEACQPDAIFAELVHVPRGQELELMVRPRLRAHEIPLLACSGAAPERQIALGDLLVSVRRGEVVLRSRRLQRRVVVRLTASHNYLQPNDLPVYRFLALLARQGVASPLFWSWGPLGSAPFLPRVEVGRVVLALARWRFTAADLAGQLDPGDQQPERVAVFRRRFDLPRFVTLEDGDNRLLVDLENGASIDAFIQVVRRRPAFTLTEPFPAPGQLCVTGPEGRFVSELIVPFTRRAEIEEVAAAPLPSATAVVAPSRRAFLPGSQWLFAKIYCGPVSADRVLRDQLAPLVEAWRARGLITRWFFVRYGDPKWHLRLRVQGDPVRLWREVLPHLEAAAARSLEAGTSWRLQLDTYEPELSRYGGETAMDLAERLFERDSEAALELLELAASSVDPADRWRIALLAVDDLNGLFGLPPSRRLLSSENVCRYLSREIAAAHAEKAISARYREHRHLLTRLLDPAAPDAEPQALYRARGVLRRHHVELRPIVGELEALHARGQLTSSLEALVGHFTHMRLNRLLRSAHRSQELIIHAFLRRLYQSNLARARAPE